MRLLKALEDLLSVEMVELEVGYGLVNLVDTDQDGDLLERITQIRNNLQLIGGLLFHLSELKIT